MPVAVPPDEPLLQFLDVDYTLPETLQELQRPFEALAAVMVRALPRNPERTVMLRKLIEAKDAAMRAYITKP